MYMCVFCPSRVGEGRESGVAQLAHVRARVRVCTSPLIVVIIIER